MTDILSTVVTLTEELVPQPTVDPTTELVSDTTSEVSSASSDSSVTSTDKEKSDIVDHNAMAASLLAGITKDVKKKEHINTCIFGDKCKYGVKCEKLHANVIKTQKNDDGTIMYVFLLKPTDGSSRMHYEKMHLNLVASASKSHATNSVPHHPRSSSRPPSARGAFRGGRGGRRS